MEREKTATGKEKPSYLPLEDGSKVAKGFAAVTQFMQPDKPKTADNGLPAQLKSRVEGLSGLPMDDVWVNYNSYAPAQVGALAYAKGNQIHLGPGQEKHLPHEARHVVQQKQGRVKPTLQAKGLAVNDDPALEAEADKMGQKATQLKTEQQLPVTMPNPSIAPATDVVQRKIGFEFQAKRSIYVKGLDIDALPLRLGEPEAGPHFKIEADVGTSDKYGELEIKTPAFDETTDGKKELIKVIDSIVEFVKEIKHNQLLTDIKGVKWYNIVDAPADKKEEKRGEEKDKEEKIVVKETEEEEAAPIKFRIIGPKHFGPQATVGVRFEKIADLIEAVTAAPFRDRGTTPGSKPPLTTGSVTVPAAVPEEVKSTAMGTQKFANTFGWNAMQTQQAFQVTSKMGLSKAKELFPAPQDAKLVGFAALLLALAYHATEGVLQPKKKGHIKYWMPFLLRNGFLPYYNALSSDQKKLFATTLRREEELFKADIAEEVASIHESISIETILVGLAAGEDVLVKAEVLGHGKITEDKESDPNLEKWGMKSIDDVGYSDQAPGPASVEEVQVKRRGAVIELRKLGDRIPPEELKAFALAVFDLSEFTNAKPPPIPPPPPPPPPD